MNAKCSLPTLLLMERSSYGRRERERARRGRVQQQSEARVGGLEVGGGIALR